MKNKTSNRLDTVTGMPACIRYIRSLTVLGLIISIIWPCLAGAMIELKKSQYEQDDSCKNSLICNARGLGLADFSFLSSIETLNNIVELDVSHNNIKDFHIQELFKTVLRLKYLDLSQNNIAKLRSHMISGLPANTSLDLSNNPIQTTSKNIVRLMAKLADKNIIIRLYKTQLPHHVLKKMESAIGGLSFEHQVYRLSTMACGVLLFVGSIPLKVLGDASSNGQSTAVQNNSSSISQDNHAKNLSYLQPISIFMFITGIALMASPLFMKIVHHDIKKSRLNWQETI